MSTLSVAVCDANQSYGESIGTYLFIEQGEKFSGGFFSALEAFREQFSKQKFEIVLLGKAFIQEAWIQEEIGQNENILWIHLWEEGEEPEALPVIEKYQPASGVIRKIYEFYEAYHKEKFVGAGKRAQIIGWYSPEQNIWQTPLALTMATILAETERTLYVNLKECSGLTYWLQEDYEQDLLDVMYFSKNLQTGEKMNLGRFTYQLGKLSYLPPVQDGILLSELKELDYLSFLEMLEQQEEYDVIVLDIGTMFSGFFSVLEKCRTIYLPQEQNVLSHGTYKDFQKMAGRSNINSVEEKIVKLSLPEWNRQKITPGCVMQQWMWGGQGDYVRELLAGTGRRD